MTNRREFLANSLALAGAITVLPRVGFAASHSGGGDVIPTETGEIKIHPIEHASAILETPAGVIYIDPVGNQEEYADAPAPNLVLITHEHGDHYSPELLTGLTGGNVPIITNPAVHGMLPEMLQPNARPLANGELTDEIGITIEAIPAHNLTENRMNFHPVGRDNGYVLNIDGRRVYFSGDTEDVPEMRSLENIDLAFVCMNLPFTMSAEQAASAVADFKPKVVYPYHYRGRNGGTQDPDEFAALLLEQAGGVEVRKGEWYPGGLEQ